MGCVFEQENGLPKTLVANTISVSANRFPQVTPLTNERFEQTPC